MRIEIKCDDSKLILTGERLDNDNFVELMFSDPNQEEDLIQGDTVNLDELLAAVESFVSLQRSRLEKEKLM